ncbi:MAG: peptidylprolyl isomerase [Flavobacteriaceae bacterium]
MKIPYLIVLVTLLSVGCTPRLFKKSWANEIAPENFAARFETSKGVFEIQVNRKLSPRAADRFYQLVKHRYFDNGIFYRVNPGFVVQFGNSASLTNAKWHEIKVPDEPVIQGNDKGYLSFARGGKNSRSTDLFINLDNNNRLDTINYGNVKGFPAFGKVSKGVEIVESLYSGYADTTMDTLNLMYTDKEKFMALFPQLDVVKSAYLIEL